MFSKIFPKIHSEGYRFLIIAGVVTLVFYALSTFLGLLGLLVTIWVYYFFRDPDRYSINEAGYFSYLSCLNDNFFKYYNVRYQRTQKFNLKNIICFLLFWT